MKRVSHNSAFKKVRLAILPTVMLAIIMLSAVGCGTTVQPVRVESPGQTQMPPAQETFGVSETVRMDALQITLNSARFDGGDDFFKPDVGTRWLVLDCTIENVGQEPASISSLLMFTLYDAENYSKELAFGPNLKGSLDGELGAGRRMAGEIAFVVGEAEQSWEFIFAPNLFGFGQAIYEVNVADVQAQ